MPEETMEEGISFLRPMPQNLFQFSETTVQLFDEVVSLSSLIDRSTILNFFITYCGPCRQEFPSLQRVRTILGSDWNVIAVNVGESKEEVLNYFKEVEWTGDVILDPKRDLAKKFAVCAFPTTYLIDKDGRIGFFIKNDVICQCMIGGIDWDTEQMVTFLKDAAVKIGEKAE